MNTVRGRALLPVPDGARRRLEADLTAAIHRPPAARGARAEARIVPRLARTARARHRAGQGQRVLRVRARIDCPPACQRGAGSRPSARCPGRSDAWRTRPALPRDRGRASPPPRAAAVPPASQALCRRSSCRPKSAAEPGGLGSNSPGFRPRASSPPSRCPACDAPEPLVATRERLGCQACTAPSGSAPTAGASRAIRQLEEFGVDEEFNVERARGR